MLEKRTFLHALKAVAATAAVCALSSVAAAPASAGEYLVPFCDQSATGRTGSWTHTVTAGGAPNFFYDSRCAPWSGYVYRRFEVWTIPAGASDDWTFDAPAGTYVSRLDMRQDTGPRSPGALNAIYAWQQDGSRSTVAASGPGTVLGNASYSFPLSGSKTIKLRNSLMCQDGANCAGTTNGYYGNEEYWLGAVVHLIDPTLPTFDSVSGAGWNSTPVDGQDRIDYTIRDTGAGVSEVRFYVDGILQSTKPAGCTAELLVPCPSTATGSFTVDTTKLSEGQHALKLTAADGASNEDSKSLTITVRRPPTAGGGASGGDPVTTSNPSSGGTGVPAVGDQLNGNKGTWIGLDLSFAYQWMRCDAAGQNCVAIPGATGTTYTPTAADVGHTLQFCVTASNSGGSTTQCSPPTAPVISAHPSTGGGGTGSTADTADLPGTPTTKPAAGSGTGAGSSVPSGDRGQPNGSSAADKVVLTAVTNNRSSTKKVKFGQRVPLSGRLTGVDGRPIASAILSVQVQTAIPGASMADAAQVVTGRDGRFTYVAPPGPSRVVRFGYRSFSGDLSFADTTDVKLLVAAGVTMKATRTKVRNRHSTVFTGRLLGKPISRRGVVVDLQVFFRNQWRTFAAPRTNKAGRYRFKYRFMAGAATWRFRARVRRETSYPYEIGVSRRSVTVKVR